MGVASGQESDVVDAQGLKSGDRAILIAAQIAEALAVTTYMHIIHTAPFFKRLPLDDQGYLKAAVQEEMSHYMLEQDVTDQFTPFSKFFYPVKMFANCAVAWIRGVMSYPSCAPRLMSHGLRYCAMPSNFPVTGFGMAIVDEHVW